MSRQLFNAYLLTAIYSCAYIFSKLIKADNKCNNYQKSNVNNSNNDNNNNNNYSK